MNTLRNLSRKSRGSAAIEFALILPIMFMLLSAVIDWGYYMSVRVSIARATMDGARAGAATPDDLATGPNETTVGARNRTLNVLAGMNRACGAGCTVTATSCVAGQGGPACQTPPIPTVVMQVTYPYTPFFGFVPSPGSFSETFIMAQQGGQGVAGN
jgi:Flp pilus assembly protein TadG